MDSLDIQIIEIIEKEGRISHEELSKRLNLSRPAIHNRVNKLETHGIITGYKATIDWQKIGYTTNAMISLRARTTNYDELLLMLKNIKIDSLIVSECYMITGTWCILMIVKCKTANELKVLQDKLYHIDSITESSITLILSAITE